MSKQGAYLSRAGRSGTEDVAKRIPELAPLRQSTISVFGLGTLGAPSAMEFARCGIRRLRLIDYDFVDPATVCRWPFGFQSVGMLKSAVLASAIKRDYPYTEPSPHQYFVGAVRSPESDEPPAHEVIHNLIGDASLVYDATAEIGVQNYLSDFAAMLGIPYVAVSASPGGWGGRVISLVPGRTRGCFYCYRCCLAANEIPKPPIHPDGMIQPAGCGDRTFTGTGFDMVEIAMTGVRTAVSALCSGDPKGYPSADWDVTIIAFRDDDGKLIPPRFSAHRIEKDETCIRCNRQAPVL